MDEASQSLGKDGSLQGALKEADAKVKECSEKGRGRGDEIC